MLARVPLTLLFLVAIVGAAIGLSPLLPSAALGAFCAVVVVASGAAIVRARHPAAQGGAVIVFVCAAASLTAVAQRAQHAQRAAALPPRDRVVVVEGVVEDVAARDEGHALRLDVQAVLPDVTTPDEAPRAVALTVDVAALAPVPLRPGDRVRLRGRLREAAPALSPGTYDAAAADLASGVDAHLSVHDKNDVAVLAHGRGAWWVEARRALSDRLQAQLPPRLAGLLLALLVGDTSLFESEQTDAYRHVGAGHLLAVSGLQVTLLAGLLLRLVSVAVQLTPAGRRGRGALVGAGAALAGVWAFVLVCGAPPSALRAGIMATAVVIASAAGRRVLLVDALAAAGLVTVVASPASVRDAGFLLSYAAVLGLVAASSGKDAVVDDGTRPLFATLRDGVIASLVAGLVTLPLSAWMFAQVAPAGLVANIVLVPAAGVLQLPALVGGTCGAVLDLPWLSTLGAQAALLLEALVFGLAERLPGTRAIDAPPAWLAFVLTVSAAGAAALLLSRRRRAALVVATVAGMALLVAGHEPGGLRVTFLPIGQGDGAVLELPDGRVFVVDGGGRVPTAPGLDEAARAEVLEEPGTRVLVPFLRRRGITRVDVVVLSHPHPDHAGGLHALVDALPVGELWWAGDVERAGALAGPLIAKVGVERTRSTPALLGAHRYGDVVVDVLAPAPDETTATYPELHANDNSLVLRLCLQATCVLFPGDLERYGEELLLASASARVRAQVVKVPHHGSTTSSTPAFVQATAAEVALLCTGRDNHFGFPAPAVVDRWQRAGARVVDTARAGETTVWLDGVDVVVRSFVPDAPPDAPSDARGPQD